MSALVSSQTDITKC